MHDRARHSHFAPLAAWIVIQLIALAASASRAPLWARFTGPTEDWALAIMLAVQIAASAMLAGSLLTSFTRALLVAMACIPFAHLAAVLSADSFFGVLRSETYVMCWIALL